MYPATGSRLLYSRNKEVMSDWVTTQACTVALGPEISTSIHVQGLKLQGDVEWGCINTILKDLSFGIVLGYHRS